MAAPTLGELCEAAASAAGPRFAPPLAVKLGGVDPLGLRQINFDLMDRVLPGINNVGRHVRPFVVTAWAWRRAAVRARDAGLSTLAVDRLKDFVDRVEVLYAWSHFLHEGGADLPGRDVLAPLLGVASYRFGGAAWRKRREEREQSTAFTAAITYGPAMKTLGWLVPDPERSGAMASNPDCVYQDALDAFEERIKDRLRHPAFSALGEVEVTSAEARGWRAAWAMDQPTEAERRAMAHALAGAGAPKARRAGVALMVSAMGRLPADRSDAGDAAALRRAMCEPGAAGGSGAMEETRLAWRTVQVRQAFRLALEALLHWTVGELLAGPRSTADLVGAFLGQVPERAAAANARAWLADVAAPNPVDAMDAIERALEAPGGERVAAAVADALAFCLRETPREAAAFERADRLPLARARGDAEAWGDEPAAAFLRHVFESWVLAQHVYWSVGRGLADARARGKTLMRLRVVLEDAGWSVAPGVGRGARPVPTRDRLETALTLARESGLLPGVGSAA
ncbi:hypothetical protein ACI6QG_14660 [Roseococcus sp. DSY-14]|uniref:hypothetical protein n=1 Tax=Roseococcus sp. DSY-14 TaxID=3369650 RepID=UPI00387AB67C